MPEVRLRVVRQAEVTAARSAARRAPARRKGTTTTSPRPAVAKPPYRVPTMAEIRALPWNGFTATSTFSGSGGSSTGYRMAGFRMAWANEFVPAARDTYRANAAPHTVLDGRDIRQVTGAELLSAAGLGVGEIDLFDGSPPCASFSTAGKREAGWGTTKKYSDTQQRSDDLFFEYARLVRECQPRTFVAENVSGLVKGTAKGYFKLILAELRACGYRVGARVLDASWLGVPQARQRLIFVGVREDLGLDPVFPKPMPFQYTVRDALPWVLGQAKAAGFGPAGGGVFPPDAPSATFGASPQTGNGYWPPGYVVGPPNGEQPPPGRDPETGQPLAIAGQIGAAVNASAARLVIKNGYSPTVSDVPADRPGPTVMAHGLGGVHYHQAAAINAPGGGQDPETGEDISLDQRHLVVRSYQAQEEGRRPHAVHFTGTPSFSQGEITDRPSPTITNGVNAVNSYHYQIRESPDAITRDPETGQDIVLKPGLAISGGALIARKLTLGELRALGGFPPDFVLTGTYAQRWERIGRAVPPVMMAQIAAAVRDGVLTPLREQGRI